MKNLSVKDFKMFVISPQKVKGGYIDGSRTYKGATYVDGTYLNGGTFCDRVYKSSGEGSDFCESSVIGSNAIV